MKLAFIEVRKIRCCTNPGLPNFRAFTHCSENFLYTQKYHKKKLPYNRPAKCLARYGTCLLKTQDVMMFCVLKSMEQWWDGDKEWKIEETYLKLFEFFRFSNNLYLHFCCYILRPFITLNTVGLYVKINVVSRYPFHKPFSNSQYKAIISPLHSSPVILLQH